MKSLRVTTAELSRVAPDIFRMVGASFGHADDAAKCLVWVQAVLGRGYGLVLQMADRNRGPWPRPKLNSDHEGVRVDMDGSPLVLYARRLVDLALVEMAGRHEIRVKVTGAFGGWVAPYIVDQIARAGYTAVLRWHPSSSSAESACIAGAEPCDVGGQNVIVGSTEDLRASMAEIDLAPAPTVGDIPERESVFRCEPDSMVLCVYKAPVPAGLPELVAQLSYHFCTNPTVGRIATDERIMDALKNGYEVDAAEHQSVIGIATRIRLPNTERSRTQGGI